MPAAHAARVSPSPAQAPWIPPRRFPGNQAAILVGVALVLLAVLVGGAILAPWLGSSPIWAFFPFCGLVIVVIVLIAANAAGAFRRPSSLPPPPPIQQPMVPAGREGPLAINCPNCGAPPGAVDRFGVAMCTHCGTRFIVR